MGRKKVYDVRPPRDKGFVGRRKDSIWKRIRGFFPEKAPRGKEGGEFSLARIFSGRNLLLLGLGALGALFLTLHLSAWAEVEIVPAGREVKLERKIEAGTEVLHPDFQKGRIRAELISGEKKIEGAFEATGVSESATKARGTITVVNDYHLKQVLISQPGRRTRLLSPEGKLFYLQKTVTVPAGGSLEVEVRAAEAGPDYNIKPTKFSLPGLTGSPRYTAVYGESSEPMKGGSVGEVSRVVEADLRKAEEKLKRKAKKKIEEKLKAEGGQNLRLPPGAFRIEPVELSFGAKRGEAVNRFEGELTARGHGLFWNREDLLSFAESAAGKQLGEKEKLKKGSLDFKVEVEGADLEKQKMSLSVGVTASAVKEIEKEKLKKSLLGRTLEQSRKYFSHYPAVEKAKIKISPFWVRRVPERMDKVEVKILED